MAQKLWRVAAERVQKVSNEVATKSDAQLRLDAESLRNVITQIQHDKGYQAASEQVIKQSDDWTTAATKAICQRNRPWLQKLAKTAFACHEKQIELARRRRQADWAEAIGATMCAQKNRGPTKLAYRWVKGITGWSRSQVGKASWNDAVPDEDGDDSDEEYENDYREDEPGSDTAKHCSLFNGSISDEPLCEQANVDLQASEWAGWWKRPAIRAAVA